MYTSSELAQIIERELAALPYPAAPEQLYTPIRYTLEGGGKRIRPVLTLMACNLFSEQIESAIGAALAMEVFHNFTLLHDDIMDRADTRRGKPAVHRRWSQNVAILSGDQMLICAYQLLGQYPPERLKTLLQIFNQVATGVCEGQQYDMDFERRVDVGVEEYVEMIRLKTALLLAGSLQMGALCAGAQEQDAHRLYLFGLNLGLAFQVQDDLLDTYGDADLLGKPVGGDIVAGKKNFLLATAITRADHATRGRLLALLENQTPGATEKIEAVKSIYAALGLREVTELRAAQYCAQALQELDQVQVDPLRLKPLRALAEELLNRKK